jgi:LAGLIDADG DNA endonuclease family protein
MTREEAAWAAGLFDGEGCIMIVKQKSGKFFTHMLRLQIKMGHKETIERVAGLFGIGNIFLTSDEKWNDQWAWIAQGPQVADVLSKLRPYLVTKAREVDVALEFAELPKTPLPSPGQPRGTKRITDEMWNEREMYYKKLQELKPSHRFRKDKSDQVPH